MYVSKHQDFGLARIKVQQGEKYGLAYFRHTEKWEETDNQLTLEECFQSILNNPWFVV